MKFLNKIKAKTKVKTKDEDYWKDVDLIGLKNLADSIQKLGNEHRELKKRLDSDPDNELLINRYNKIIKDKVTLINKFNSKVGNNIRLMPKPAVE